MARADPDREVSVIREQDPRVDPKRSGGRQRREAGRKVGSVGVIAEDEVPLQPLHHHVMEGGQSIQAGLSRHGRRTPAELAQFGNVCPSVPYPVRNKDLGLRFHRINNLAFGRYQVPYSRACFMDPGPPSPPNPPYGC
jgi:hypothetical protein